MNPLHIPHSKKPLLTYEMEGPNSQRNMSTIEFINYYKEPYYKETGGIINEMFIRAFSFGESYLGMNYDPERMTEELAKEQAALMDFQNCDFYLIRSNKNDGIMNAICSADRGKLEHNEDLLITAYLHSDTFDKWLSIIQNRQNSRISLKIQFNQDARDLFLGSLMMNYLGDYDEEDNKIHFDINKISLNLRAYESFPKPQLSHPPA